MSLNRLFITTALLLSVLTPVASAQVWQGFPSSSPSYDTLLIPVSVTTGDFNGDGITDLAIANAGHNRVSVLLGDEDSGNLGFGDGTFADQVTYSVGHASYSVTTGDFNGDGITDLVTGNPLSTNVSVLLGNGTGGVGDGTFATQATYAAGDETDGVTTGDFNGDGITDLATANRDSDNVSVLLGNEDAGNLGFGDGTFAAQVTYSAGTGAASVTAGDFNGDGITDLAVANRNSDNVSVLLGNEDAGNPGFGDGTFAAQVTYTAGDVPESVMTGDFNDDGITDLATANLNSDNVSVLLGNGTGGVGDGTFAAQVTYTAGDGSGSMTTGDFNGDGITDLATANKNSHTVSVLLGNGTGGVGDGTFAAPLTYSAGNTPESLTTGDFNGDAFPDLAVTTGSDEVLVMLNLGTTYPVESDPVLTPADLAFGDVELGSGASNLSTIIDVTGDDDLISTPTLTNDGGGVFSLVSVPVSPLAQGTSDTLTVAFVPSALGLTTGTVTLETNDSSSPTITIALSGTGVDTQAPTSAATAPTGSLTVPSDTFDVEHTASDNTGGSGVASVELYYQRDGGGYVSYGTFTSSPVSFDTSGTGGDGTYDFYTVATDNASNVELKAATAEVSVIFNDVTTVRDWSVLND